jgi:hypothetical protein
VKNGEEVPGSDRTRGQLLLPVWSHAIMEYPPTPYPPYIQDSGDAAPMLPVDILSASTVANDREPGPCSGRPVDADRALLTHNPSEFPQSGYDEEHFLNKPLQNDDIYPDFVLPLVLQAPAEIFRGSRNALPFAPDIYPTQDSPPSTPSSYTASPKTPARSLRSFTSVSPSSLSTFVVHLDMNKHLVPEDSRYWGRDDDRCQTPV